MKQATHSETVPAPGSVVGTIHSPGAAQAALELAPDAVDFLELRVDAFTTTPEQLSKLETIATHLAQPLIVTVRHPEEGGANRLGPSERRQLFERFLPLASLIDLELRSLDLLPEIVPIALERGCGVILSCHDFQSTPSLDTLRRLAVQARKAGGTLLKVATTATTASDLCTLLRFLTDSPALPLAVMGMGVFGKTSRLALGRAGSRLNYGYLDSLQVSGQWPAELLKQRLAEL